jgi:LysM repeat protein
VATSFAPAPVVVSGPSILGSRGGSGGSSPSSSSSTSSGAGPSASSDAPGTRVIGDSKGRDPDLIYTGEKISVNGKSHTVKNGETLSSIARANGTSVDALIKENNMDASLLGKTSRGQYFSAGGPTPSPGGAQASAPDPLAPAGPNGRYTKEQAPLLKDALSQWAGSGNGDSAKVEKIEKAIPIIEKLFKGEELSDAETKQLVDLFKEVKQSPTETAKTEGAGSTGASADQSGSSRKISSEEAAHYLKELKSMRNIKNLPDDVPSSQGNRAVESLKTLKAGGSLTDEQQSELVSTLNKVGIL